MAVETHFLCWHSDALSLAAECLTKGWKQGDLDLRDRLVVVPTRNAGRRLREKLAEIAATEGNAVIPGRIVTPEYFMSDHYERFPSQASSSEMLALWIKLLKNIDFQDYPALFPSVSSAISPDDAWALSTAEQFVRLRRELGEGGFSFNDVAGEMVDSPEPERWRDLARLEAIFRKELESLGLDDPEEVKTNIVANPILPDRVKSVYVIAVPDPLPLAVTALENIAASHTVNVYVQAPADLKEGFDCWGRPLVDFWSKRNIDIPDEENSVILAEGPRDQAGNVSEILEQNKQKPDSVAIGVPDEEVTPHLTHELAQREIETFNPAGETLEAHPIMQLIDCLTDVIISGDFESFSTLIRHPDVMAYLEQNDENIDSHDLLLELDRFQNNHLPPNYQVFCRLVKEHQKPDSVLNKAVDLLSQHFQNIRNETDNPVISLIDTLREIYSTRDISTNKPDDKTFADAATHVSDFSGEIMSDVLEKILDGHSELLLKLFRQQLYRKRVYTDRPVHAVDLQGWLELPWDDAPYLVITGMNDGKVPETIVGDKFLPDSARTRLGLKNNSQRFARDAYMLSAILNSRKNSGKVVLVSGKTSERNDPLKPSRLFFLCDEEKLVSRARYLFSEVAAVNKRVSTETTCRYKPFFSDEYKNRQSFSVTQLNSYLDCPFRFYLKHILRMEEIDDRKQEMDARDFGNIVHEVLADVLSTKEYQNSTDSQYLERALNKALDEKVTAIYGPHPASPVTVQIESARQRLFAAARRQAGLAEEGWQTVETEKDARTFIGDTEIRARIDRIDRHPDGRVRVLDYKTSEKGAEPQSNIWKSAAEDTEDYKRVNLSGKEKEWCDLQLPLYVYLVRQQFPEQEIECGYFNIPKAVTETDVSLWQVGYEWNTVQTAVTCAEDVIEKIKAGKFRPPSSSVDYDDFEKLFVECESPFDQS